MTSLLWVPLALASAFSLAVRDTVIKELSNRGDSIFTIMAFFGFLSALAALVFQEVTGSPDPAAFLKPEALKTLALMLPLEIIGFALYYTALTYSPITVTVPFLTFTPVAAPFFSLLFLGEAVSPAAFGGILLVALGGYTLFFRSPRDLLLPFKSFLSEKGSVMMFLTALIYSVTSVLGRKMSLVVGADTMGGYYPLMNAVGLNLLLVLSGKLKVKELRSASPLLFALGVLGGAVMVLTHFSAISLTNAAYMVSVKRSSALFSFFMGVIFFKEKEWLPKLAGTAIMLTGLVLVILKG